MLFVWENLKLLSHHCFFSADADTDITINNTNIAKFGDTGIKELYNQMVKAGANPRRLVAKIAGGAKMFEMASTTAIGCVGDRNTEMAKQMLSSLKIPLKAEDTGLNYGRTVILDCETGNYIIKAVGKSEKVI